MSELAQYTVALYADLDSKSNPCFEQVGSLDLAHTESRLTDFRRYATDVSSQGLDEATMLSSEEVANRVPMLDTDNIYGGLFVPTEDYADAVSATEAFGHEATANGVSFHPYTTVEDVETTDGQVEAVRIDSGRIETERVLLATNIWARILADQLDIKLPVYPVEHQYAITEPLDELTGDDTRRSPFVRARDHWIYARQHDNAIGIGTYHDEPTLVEPDDIGNYDGRLSVTALRQLNRIIT
jgi:dimethylglycine oxidase